MSRKVKKDSERYDHFINTPCKKDLFEKITARAKKKGFKTRSEYTRFIFEKELKND